MVYPGEAARTTSTTTTGTTFTDVTIDPFGSGQTSRVLIPDGVLDGDAITLMIVAHGASDLAANIHNWFYRATKEGALDRGWVLISSDAHGNAWSKQAALDDYRRCYDWIAGIWNIQHVLLSGWSMGGLTVINLSGKNVIPKVRAVASIDGALSIRAAWEGNYAGQINAAYGIAANGSNYDALTAGFDPCLADPVLWAGKRIFMTASTGDTAIPKPLHSDVFYSRISSYANVTYKIGSGIHVDAPNFFPADALAFFDAALLAPIIPEVTFPPAASWKGAAVSAWYQGEWIPAVPKLRTANGWEDAAQLQVGST